MQRYPSCSRGRICKVLRHLSYVLAAVCVISFLLSADVLWTIYINHGIPRSSHLAWEDWRTGEPVWPQPVVTYVVTSTSICCLALVVVSLLLRSAFRERKIADRTRRGCCPRCGYDVRATPDHCPECGAIPPAP
jgi:hypothetical protein